MITVSNLTRRFGPFTAVDDISFSLDKGEVVGFLGPNGAGKTTTMRMLTGFLPVTSGSITVAGFDVLRDSLEVRRRIGYLAESVPLYPEHRVEEMLLFQGRLHGLARAESRRRGAAVLERVGMLDRSRSIVGRLSKGQRQRIGLAVALLPDPEVLILDEPTSGLDPLQRIEVRSLVGDLANERTVLFSSHILPEIEAVAARVIILHKGRIAADGPKDALVDQLGGETFVRFEGVVGPDAEAARKLLSTLPGVASVEDHGQIGIHHRFRVHGTGDLREDVGALCMQRSWAVRELSWERPTLENLFARIAFEMEIAVPDPENGPGVTPPPATAKDGPALGRLDVLETPPAPPPQASKMLYNLNPFDGGAERDLSRPKPGEIAPETGSEACPPKGETGDGGQPSRELEA
ncbi:MAG: hypothetical protein CMJ89_16185 [Planctomycetes bacterium]|nr:hypothetical protein [Planctomycetota bacterium]